MKVNILGVEYEIIESTEAKDPKLNGKDGYCDTTIKICVVENMEESKKDLNAKKDLEEYKKSVKRHELIHAFLYESGLDCCSNWATNEEMVDFFAIQFPKMLKAFQDVEAL